jgi:hypothetical protein
VLTEGALLDENGHHLYPIQGPPVTLHSHFGSSQALGRGIIKRQSQFRIQLAGLGGYFGWKGASDQGNDKGHL